MRDEAHIDSFVSDRGGPPSQSFHLTATASRHHPYALTHSRWQRHSRSARPILEFDVDSGSDNDEEGTNRKGGDFNELPMEAVSLVCFSFGVRPPVLVESATATSSTVIAFAAPRYISLSLYPALPWSSGRRVFDCALLLASFQTADRPT